MTILVVASRGDGPLNARPTAGDAYVVFGPVAQGGVVDVALSEQDSTIYGTDSDDKLAQFVYLLAMGDLNGDGTEDILVGSEAADGPGNARNLGGEAYVIFGRPTIGGTIDLALSEGDIIIYGGNEGHHLGSVAAGDVNGDGVDEVLVAAPYADGANEARLSCGEAYVISLADSDGDGLLDIADPCPDNVDCDDDQRDDYVEQYIGTDPLDACPDMAGTPGLCPGPTCDGDDCWPFDLNVDRRITIGDVLFFRLVMGSALGGANYDRRYDLDASGRITIGDVLFFGSVMGQHCTNP